MDLLEMTKKAINNVFSDTSVSPEETKSRLTELQDQIEMCIDSLPDEDAE